MSFAHRRDVKFWTISRFDQRVLKDVQPGSWLLSFIQEDALIVTSQIVSALLFLLCLNSYVICSSRRRPT